MLRRRSPFTNREWLIGKRSGLFCAIGKSTYVNLPRPGPSGDEFKLSRPSVAGGAIDAREIAHPRASIPHRRGPSARQAGVPPDQDSSPGLSPSTED
jgi:hypothetical protein